MDTVSSFDPCHPRPDLQHTLGMARIFTCAPGTVKLMLGREWSESGLPECFQMSELRLSKLADLGSDHQVIDHVWQTSTAVKGTSKRVAAML